MKLQDVVAGGLAQAVAYIAYNERFVVVLRNSIVNYPLHIPAAHVNFIELGVLVSYNNCYTALLLRKLAVSL